MWLRFSINDDFGPQFISMLSSKVNVLNDWRADSFPKKRTTWSTTGQNGMYRGSQKWNELKWRHNNDVISNSFHKKIFIHLKRIWNRNHLRIFWIFAEIFPRIDYDITISHDHFSTNQIKPNLALQKCTIETARKLFGTVPWSGWNAFDRIW